MVRGEALEKTTGSDLLGFVGVGLGNVVCDGWLNLKCNTVFSMMSRGFLFGPVWRCRGFVVGYDLK